MLLSRIVRYTGIMDGHDDPQQLQTTYPTQPLEPTTEQDEPRQFPDLSRYSLTVEEAADLFVQGGVPRSLRTVIRYCGNGALDCIKVDTERNPKYLVAPDSIHTRIDELKQIMSYGHDVSRLDMSRHDTPVDETRHDTTSYDTPRGENKKMEDLTSRVGELERENEELKTKNRDLEITNRVKNHLLMQNESKLGAARSQLMRFNRAIGELATILRLKAPDEDTSRIIAYLDDPNRATDREDENLVDVSS
jgi:hypothetical protein